MKALLTHMVSAIVRDPDAVQIDEGERRGEPVLIISVGEGDRGAVIGRQGRTIRALETIISTVADGGRIPGLEIAD